MTDDTGSRDDEGDDAVALAARMRSGAVSARELVDAAIARIEATNPAINAVIQERFDAARREADGGLPDGPFRGVPILLKDLNAQMPGEPCYLGTTFLKEADYRPPVQNHVVTRLRRAGFVILGRTNTPEFATSPTTEPVSYGPTRNPWDLGRSAGGSSGGAAAAVAAGMVPVAHASDGGGSIRIPASCNGIFGLKPSRGRISRGPQAGEGWGGASTDGVVSRTVRDSAALLDVLAGYETGDPYTAPPPVRPYATEPGVAPGRLRVGVRTDTPGGAPADPACATAVRSAADLLSELGHDVVDASPAAMAEPEYGEHYLPLLTVATAQSLVQWSEVLGREVRIDEVEPFNQVFATMGRTVSGTEYLSHLTWLHAWSRRMVEFWRPADDPGSGFDLLLTPTLASPPVPIGSLVPPADDPLPTMLEVGNWVAFTSHFNVTGQPAMNLPLHWTEPGDGHPAGLPVGVQLVGPPFGEDLLLQVAAQVETARPWNFRYNDVAELPRQL